MTEPNPAQAREAAMSISLHIGHPQASCKLYRQLVIERPSVVALSYSNDPALSCSQPCDGVFANHRSMKLSFVGGFLPLTPAG